VIILHYDIAIIGGGPGGYVAAIYAAKKKAKIALVEKGELGGTCLNRGCIPTKTLIHGANLLQVIRNAKEFGITVNNADLNWELLQKKTLQVVKNLSKGVESLLAANNVEVIKGVARLLDKHTIDIVSETGQDTITADNIILATGSVPALVPIPGYDLQNVITSDQALFLKEIPSSMLIIGGGVIGLEIGYIYNTFGTKVTIVEMLPEILPRQDSELCAELKKQLQKQGIEFYTESRVMEIKEKDGMLLTIFETKNGTKTINSEKVLMATGRTPVIDAFKDICLDVDKTGLVVDEYLKTNLDNIYAVGDVTGKSMLAHVASHQGIIAVKNILGEKQKIDYKAIPSCIYTSPEMASVGLTEQEARRIFKDNIKVGRFSYAASGKAMTIGERIGFVKIIAEPKYNEILGVHIVGPNATELIAEAVLAVKLECTAEEVAYTIHAHPTLSEAVMEAAFDLMKEPIHKL